MVEGLVEVTGRRIEAWSGCSQVGRTSAGGWNMNSDFISMGWRQIPVRSSRSFAAQGV